MCKKLLERCCGSCVDDVLWKEVVKWDQSKQLSSQRLAVRAVAVLVELLVVASRGESCCVAVRWRHFRCEEFEEVLVRLLQRDLVK